MKQEFVYKGYESLEKTVGNGGHSGRISVPPRWVGKRVRVILLEPLEPVE
jgi:putative transposon-encoded protein